MKKFTNKAVKAIQSLCWVGYFGAQDSKAQFGPPDDDLAVSGGELRQKNAGIVHSQNFG